VKHYSNNPLLTMDNVILNLDYIDIKKLDCLQVKLPSITIYKFDIDGRVDIFF